MEPTEHNRRAWDEIHRSAEGAPGIPDEIRKLLPDVTSKHVLHLQCGTGESTAQLVELGALVTALDLTTDALDSARKLAPDVAYVHADMHELPLELRRGRFDLVYTGDGVLGELRDLEAWAEGIAAALKPGGMLVLQDEHPIAASVDALGHWREDYFGGLGLGVIVDALTAAGLRLTRLVEFQTLHPWIQRDRRIPWDFALLATKEPPE